MKKIITKISNAIKWIIGILKKIVVFINKVIKKLLKIDKDIKK